MTALYFAYGSNMRASRLRDRAPLAEARGVARLRGYELRFHKRAGDGSAKCDAFFTGRESDVVIGVLFDLGSDDWEALDRAEGRGVGYDRVLVEVDVDEAVTAWVYLARADHIDDALLPSSSYRDLVLAGAEEHGLPQAYVARIAAQRVG